jgi:outer membrane protein assembly factor BamB
MSVSPSRRASARVIVLVIALGVVVVTAGTIAWMRWATIRNWFDRDAENADEMNRLAAAPAKSPPPAPAGVGWPQWRGPLRDGRAPDGPFRTDWDKNPPKQLWKADCGGGFSSLAVVGGKLYTQDREGGNERVLCLDAETGNPLWDYPYPADYSGMKAGYATGPRATPTIDGDRLYAVGATGKFVCLVLPATGTTPKLAWEHDLLAEFRASSPEWGVACSPLVEGDLVIVQPGGKDGSVVAFDKASGEVRWKAGSNPSGYSSPVAATVGNLRVVYAMTGDALLCVRASDGTVLDKADWVTEFKGNIATPVVHEDYVFVSSGYGKGCALFRAAADGDKVRLTQVYMRKNRVMRNHHSTCVFKDGYLYGFDDNRFACVDFKKGIEQEGWEDPGFLTKGSVILASNHLIVLTENGQLGLVEATPTEARLIAKVPSGLSGRENWSLPVLVDGRLYLRDGQKILCLDVRP